MRIHLIALHERAARRKPGYAEAMLAAGQVQGDHLEIDAALYRRIGTAYALSGGEHPLPSIGTQAGNFLHAVSRVAKAAVSGQPILVPDHIRAARLAQCAGGCAYWRPSDQRCSLCGCWTSTKFARKLSLATERCPATPAKWGSWAGDPQPTGGDPAAE
jgi:hypothetical protein